jgi:hypothetical protein
MELPLRVHANGFKMKLLAVILGLMAALFLRGALRGAEGAAPAVLWAAGLGFLIAAVLLWRTGLDERPALIVSEAGLEDRLFGFIPWEDVARYRLHGSMFSPGFGYDLKKGAQPPRNATLFRIQALMNKSSLLSHRMIRKQMVIGGGEPILLAARAARPELEAR